MTHDRTTGLLFVCLGNICRSPLAEGIFLHLAETRGVRHLFDVDSCGLGDWHVGERADPRSRAIARRHGIELACVARTLDPRRDFERFELLLPMDSSNERRLLALGADRARVRLMRSFDPAVARAGHEPPDVPDPYTDDEEGFARVFEMLHASCTGLLDELLRGRPSA